MKGYKDVAKRLQYLRNWRKNNRPRLREYYKDYMVKNGYSVKINPELPTDGYCGTSGLGRKYEKIALQLLKGSSSASSFHGPWDIEWNGKKVEVKMRNKLKSGSYSFTFAPRCKADYALLFCVDKGITKIVLFIPFNILKNFNGRFRHIRIKDDGKYDKYKIVTEN